MIFLIFLVYFMGILSYGSSHIPPINVSQSLSTCCTYITHSNSTNTNLMQCINQSNIEVVDSFVRIKSKPVVAVVTRATEDIYSYAAYSIFLQSIHADHNGYLHYPVLPDNNEPDYRTHKKLTHILNAFNSTAYELDYIVWMDADSIFLDLEMCIEDVILEFSDSHILISAGSNSLVNTGFIIFRKAAWTENFLLQWLEARKQQSASDLPAATFTDTMGFEHVYRSLPPEERRLVTILHPEALNSLSPPMARQLPHHRILHLAGETLSMRRNAFKLAAQEVCSALDEERSPSHQLGLTREVIRSIAEKSHRETAIMLLERFVAANNSAHTVPLGSLVGDLHDLRFSVGHYQHAVSYGNSSEERSRAMNLYLEAYKTITKEVDYVHDYIAITAASNRTNSTDAAAESSEDSRKAWITWIDKMRAVPEFYLLPKLLLMSAEFSYELLNFLGPLVYQGEDLLAEWNEVASRVLTNTGILGELLQESDAVFYSAAVNMRASILRDMGMLYMHRHNYAAAISSLRDSMTVYERIRIFIRQSDPTLPHIFDREGELKTHTALAQTLCMDRQFGEGLARFEVIIDDMLRDFGNPLHPSLAEKFLSKGICEAEFHRSNEATRSLQHVLNICRRNEGFNFGDTPDRAFALLRMLENEARRQDL
mmetsp:Transcript_359/g.656  ORF Transcript_359/g.656 Transcript_359/m.656 type:complete len:654 (-) Transcript_359:147-2108(-)